MKTPRIESQVKQKKNIPKNKKLYCPNCQKEQNYVTDYIAGKQALAKYCAVCDTHIEEKYKLVTDSNYVI